jgi:Flp pilus assembly pilin Flp
MITARYLQVRAWLDAFLNREDGQDLAEYAILLGLIALAVIVAVMAFGASVGGIFSAFNASWPGAAPVP